MQKCSDIAEQIKKLHSLEVPYIPESFTPLPKMLESVETIHLMEYLCLSIQSILSLRLEEIECGAKCRVHSWLHPNESGGGITCVIENGSVFDKALVNVFVICLPLTEGLRKQILTGEKDLSNYSSFKTVAISSVLHPKNPHTPTLHFTFRYCEMHSKHSYEETICWFGGSSEITPYVLHKEDIISFHKSLKQTCEKFDVTYYPKFKKLADEYYYIPHRREHVGMGGILFDELTGDHHHLLNFVTECATTVISAYIPILQRTMCLPVTQEEIEWMHIRRGRFAEFFLIYDLETRFRLNMPGAKIESFLSTLPSFARWSYCHDPDPKSPQGILMSYIKNPVDWV